MGLFGRKSKETKSEGKKAEDAGSEVWTSVELMEWDKKIASEGVEAQLAFLAEAERRHRRKQAAEERRRRGSLP